MLCSFSPTSGVEVLRLDAAAFLWKRLGTRCQNQPEVHDLLQALRAACRIAAPAVIHKGGGDRRRRRTSSPISAPASHAGTRGQPRLPQRR